MKPYYQDEFVTIYHGDSREIAPTLGRFDLLLTDPPYGINGSSGQINKARNKGGYESNFQDTPEFIKTVVSPFIAEQIQKIRTVILTPGSKCCNYYPQPDSVGVFYSPAACGMQRFGNADANLIFYYGKMPNQNLRSPCSWQLTERADNVGHPCTKPTRAWMRLLSKGSIESDLILDPFGGSGTTGLVSKELGRKCTLIELEEKYCEIAAKRMDCQLNLF